MIVLEDLPCQLKANSVPNSQGVAKRLAGQQLARFMLDAGLPVTPAAARSSDAADLRKFAVQAALAQEMSIYRKDVGKQVSFFLELLVS